MCIRCMVDDIVKKKNLATLIALAFKVSQKLCKNDYSLQQIEWKGLQMDDMNGAVRKRVGQQSLYERVSVILCLPPPVKSG